MTPTRTGLFVSLALHGLIAGLLWWLWFKPAPAPKPPTALPISLRMFAPAPVQTPAPAPVQTPTVPQVSPEPAAPVEPPAPSPEPPPEPTPEPPKAQTPRAEPPIAPKQAEPKQAEPKQAEPKQAEPKPAHPKPVAPKPVKPKPAEPAPSAHPAAEPAQTPPTDPAPPANGAPAAPASAPTPPAKPSAAQQQDLLAAYQAALAAAIEREKFYPPLARRLNQEGSVEIGFTVLADGRIVNIHLLTQAPSAALERGAMAAIAGVGQFKPIPPQLGMGTMNLTISLVYKLR
ncbi:MAG: hypothetical protein B7Y53_04085 [Halothiobacillus sp. 28-55-5]|nr:MAG: hypothetical protein B7Y53_04085 [Halothiobacillus sp. 28-55-5]